MNDSVPFRPVNGVSGFHNELHHQPDTQQHAAVDNHLQRERDAGMYLTSRIEELESTVVAQTVAIEASRSRELQLHKTISGLKDCLDRSRAKQEELEGELTIKRDVEESLNSRVEALLGETQSLRAQLQQATMQYDAERKALTETALHVDASLSQKQQQQSGSGALVKSVPADRSDSTPLQALKQLCSASYEQIEDFDVTELRHRLRSTVAALNEAHGVIAALTTSSAKAKHVPTSSTVPDRRQLNVFSGDNSPFAGASNTGLRLGMSTSSQREASWLVRENAALSLRVSDLEHELQRHALDRRLGL